MHNGRKARCHKVAGGALSTKGKGIDHDHSKNGAPVSAGRAAQSQTPEMVLLKRIPVELRRQIFPDGMPTVRQITGDVLLREKLREHMQSVWQHTKRLLQWKAANGFCANGHWALCEARLTEEDKAKGHQSCARCRDYDRRYNRKGESGQREGFRKNQHSSYGLWRKVERAAASAERARKQGGAR